MKRNFVSILILGLTIVNIAISAITLFSVVSTNQKTAAIVTQVASVLSVDVGGGTESDVTPTVPIEDILTYAIPDKMTIELKSSDGDAHYCMVSVFFSMNSKHEDYKKYGATVDQNEKIFKSVISDVFQEYTIDEARSSQDEIKAKILKEVQNKYSGSDFIFDVSFSDIMFQ